MCSSDCLKPLSLTDFTRHFLEAQAVSLSDPRYIIGGDSAGEMLKQAGEINPKVVATDDDMSQYSGSDFS